MLAETKKKIEKISRGFPIIYEESLEEMLKNTLGKGKLKPTTNLKEAILNSDISFICVGTPSKTDGCIDLSQIKEASEKIGRALAKKNNHHVVVARSTVVPGTTESSSGH